MLARLGLELLLELLVRLGFEALFVLRVGLAVLFVLLLVPRLGPRLGFALLLEPRLEPRLGFALLLVRRLGYVLLLVVRLGFVLLFVVPRLGYVLLMLPRLGLAALRSRLTGLGLGLIGTGPGAESSARLGLRLDGYELVDRGSTRSWAVSVWTGSVFCLLRSMPSMEARRMGFTSAARAREAPPPVPVDPVRSSGAAGITNSLSSPLYRLVILGSLYSNSISSLNCFFSSRSARRHAASLALGSLAHTSPLWLEMMTSYTHTSTPPSDIVRMGNSSMCGHLLNPMDTGVASTSSCEHRLTKSFSPFTRSTLMTQPGTGRNGPRWTLSAALPSTGTSAGLLLRSRDRGPAGGGSLS
mmetsp:Transcript_24685/g.33868  ORF Transcript_24685/g.33868 Transcript_24685/m.33868 type:complete len:356 (+) Transcript_24685:1409-2476(+)